MRWLLPLLVLTMIAVACGGSDDATSTPLQTIPTPGRTGHIPGVTPAEFPNPSPEPATPRAGVPTGMELDLKLLAVSLDEKKLRMASQKEAERLTRMQVGGISVLGLRGATFEALIDERARDLETIHISAGERGTEIALRTVDLVALSGSRYVPASS